MTDSRRGPDPARDPAGEPAVPPGRDEARVRRLLGEARHDEPLPADVADRLDGVLARLEAGEPVGPVPGPRTTRQRVVELAARRRRRAASVLVAAAAVVVVGIGLGQVVDAGSGDASPSAASEAVAEGGAVADTGAGADRDQLLSGSEESGSLGEGPAQLGQAVEDEAEAELDGQASAYSARVDPGARVLVVGDRLLPVPDEGFTRAAARVQRSVLPRRGTPLRPRRAGPDVVRVAEASRPVRRAWQGCAPAAWGAGTLVAVEYQQDPAVLALRRPAGESQVVELLQCGTGEPLRTATLPRR